MLDMAQGDVMFAATGVTNGTMLKGVRRFAGGALTHSVVMRSKTGTVRYIEAKHDFTRKQPFAPLGALTIPPGHRASSSRATGIRRMDARLWPPLRGVTIGSGLVDLIADGVEGARSSAGLGAGGRSAAALAMRSGDAAPC